MSVSITINGIDWTTKIGDLALTAKDAKRTVNNIKGDGITLTPRSGSTGKNIKFNMFYLTRADYNTLNALYLGGLAIPCTFAGIDLPSGDYVASELAMQLVKAMDSYVYNVSITFQQDLVAQIPVPARPLSAYVSPAQHLGW